MTEPTYTDEGVSKKKESDSVDISPDKSCNYCNGTGSEGRNIHTNRIVVCRCVIKKIQKLKLKGGYRVRGL
jgi:hypothetical protein